MRYGIWIDPASRQYAAYVWALELKNGKTLTYRKIEKIYINEVSEAATVQARAASFTARRSVFKAFLKFEDGTKVHLDTHRKRTKLEAKVKHYKQMLEVSG